MHLVELTRGRFAIVDDVDVDLVRGYAWSVRSGASGTMYASSVLREADALNGPKTLTMHRLIMQPPNGWEVDHINGDGLDNRRCNLRICTRTQNARNVRAQQGSSSFKGVSWIRSAKKWRAGIRASGKKIYLGQFDAEEDAARAYDDAARTLHGEFAWLNFPRYSVPQAPDTSNLPIVPRPVMPKDESRVPFNFRSSMAVRAVLESLALRLGMTTTDALILAIQECDPSFAATQARQPRRTGSSQLPTVSVNVRLPREVKVLVVDRSRLAGLTMTDWVARAIEEQSRREGVE